MLVSNRSTKQSKHQNRVDLPLAPLSRYLQPPVEQRCYQTLTGDTSLPILGSGRQETFDVCVCVRARARRAITIFGRDARFGRVIESRCPIGRFGDNRQACFIHFFALLLVPTVHELVNQPSLHFAVCLLPALHPLPCCCCIAASDLQAGLHSEQLGVSGFIHVEH